jgi:pimeloyl-ACP methyl ester carboxylesterase
MIVTKAGVAPNVSAIVYVAARPPDAGEDYAALAKKFAGDLPEAQARVLYAVRAPFKKTLLSGKTTQAAWRSKPSFYAVSTEDRTINPDLERFMAKRMNAKTIELPSSHLSMISHPQEITNLILEPAGQH